MLSEGVLAPRSAHLATTTWMRLKVRPGWRTSQPTQVWPSSQRLLQRSALEGSPLVVHLDNPSRSSGPFMSAVSANSLDVVWELFAPALILGSEARLPQIGRPLGNIESSMPLGERHRRRRSRVPGVVDSSSILPHAQPDSRVAGLRQLSITGRT